MTTKWKLFLAALTGIAIGVEGGIAIRSQPVKPAPGYVIAEVDIHDLAAFQKYGARVPETLAPFSHQYLVRSNKVHYGQELSSANRPDTFEQTIHPRQRFSLQAGGGPYNSHRRNSGERVGYLTWIATKAVGRKKLNERVEVFQQVLRRLSIPAGLL